MSSFFREKNGAEVKQQYAPSEEYRSLKPRWKHFSYHWAFFAVPLIVHAIQIATLIFILSKWPTNADIFRFSYKTGAAYFCWQYLPLVSVVGVSFFWELLDINVRRLEPFYLLSREDGATVKESLSSDYLTSYIYFVPWRAWKHKHFATLFSSTTYILAFTVLPTLSAILWKIQWDQDGNGSLHLSLPAVYSTIIVLILILISAINLWLILNRRNSGLFGDPGSIGGIASLLVDSDVRQLFGLLRSYDSQATIDKTIGHITLRLGFDPQCEGEYKLYTHGRQTPVKRLCEKKFNQSRREAHSWAMYRRTYIAYWILLNVLYMILGLANVIHMRLWAIKPLYTLIFILITSVWQNWQRDVAVMQPFYEMRIKQRKRDNRWTHRSSASGVHMNFSSCSIWTTFSALHPSRMSVVVSLISFCTFFIQLSVIINPIQADLGARAIEAERNPSAAFFFSILEIKAQLYTGIVCTIPYFMNTVGIITMLCYRGEPFMPRKPFTLSSTITYLCNSSGLLEDFRGTSTMSHRDRERHVRERRSRYTFGWFSPQGDENWRVGIEQGDQVLHPFVYRKKWEGLCHDEELVMICRNKKPLDYIDATSDMPVDAWYDGRIFRNALS